MLLVLLQCFFIVLYLLCLYCICAVNKKMVKLFRICYLKMCAFIKDIHCCWSNDRHNEYLCHYCSAMFIIDICAHDCFYYKKHMKFLSSQCFSSPRWSWQLCSRACLKISDKQFVCNQLCHETISTSSSLHWLLSPLMCCTYAFFSRIPLFHIAFAKTEILSTIAYLLQPLMEQVRRGLAEMEGRGSVWPSIQMASVCTVHVKYMLRSQDRNINPFLLEEFGPCWCVGHI